MSHAVDMATEHLLPLSSMIFQTVNLQIVGFPSQPCFIIRRYLQKMFVIDPMSSEKSHHSIPMFPTVACILVAISKGVSTFGLIQGSGTLCCCPICGKHNNKSWLNRGLLLGIPRIKHDNNHKFVFVVLKKWIIFPAQKEDEP